jgi:DNA-binding NarL/FixJ family response regulator
LKKKILIVEDHPIVMEGITRLINSMEKLTVCAGTYKGEDVPGLIKSKKPDLIIMDLVLKDGNGLNLIKDLKISYPEILILVVSMKDEKIYAERALKAGAKGYIMKGESTSKIINAVKEILKGRIYLSENMKSSLLEKYMSGAKHTTEPLDVLSDRELEVFKLIGQGIGTSEIADKMNLSSKTIETYYSKIKKKLFLKNFRELTRAAFEWNGKENL